APFVVRLIRVGAELEEDVAGSVLVGNDNIRHIEVAIAVRAIDEVDRVITGGPPTGVDIVDPRRPSGADCSSRHKRFPCVQHFDVLAAPHELAIAIRVVSDAEDLDGPLDRSQARPRGQHQVKGLTRRYTMLVGIAPDARVVVIAFPDRLLTDSLVESRDIRTGIRLPPRRDRKKTRYAGHQGA